MVLMNPVLDVYAGKALLPIGTNMTKEPEIGAGSAIMYCVDLDQVVYSKNSSERVDPYSTTKLMTAYLVVNNLGLDDTIVVSKAATEDPDDGSTIFLEEGEQVTVEQLLYGLVLTSGNDAALALAEAVSGTVAEFCELMNQTARDLGCKDTHFVNPNGLQDANHYTTAEDFLIIAKAAFNDDTVFKIACTKQYTMPATLLHEARVFKNHTSLYRTKGSGVLGGKTGYWDDSDCSVVLRYQKKDLDMILLLFKASKDEREKDATKLLKYAHDISPGYIVYNPTDSIKKIWVRGGERTHINIYPKTKVYAYPKGGKTQAIKTKVKLHPGLKAPIKAGTVIGTLTVKTDKTNIGEYDIVLRRDLGRGWFPSQIYISNRGTIIIIASLILLIVLIALLRRINRARARRRRELRRRREIERLAREEQMQNVEFR